jgi:hypothetical protein
MIKNQPVAGLVGGGLVGMYSISTAEILARWANWNEAFHPAGAGRP